MCKMYTAVHTHTYIQVSEWMAITTLTQVIYETSGNFKFILSHVIFFFFTINNCSGRKKPIIHFGKKLIFHFILEALGSK